MSSTFLTLEGYQQDMCNENEKYFTLFTILRAACDIFKRRRRSLRYYYYYLSHEEASRSTELPFLDWMFSFQNGKKFDSQGSPLTRSFFFGGGGLFSCLNPKLLLHKRKCYHLPKGRRCVLRGHVYARLTWSHSLSSTREMVLSFNSLRICPKEIIQNVGDRENAEHKDKFLALLFRLVKDWNQPKDS